jgi:hypothetical protein
MLGQADLILNLCNRSKADPTDGVNRAVAVVSMRIGDILSVGHCRLVSGGRVKF